MSVTPPTFTDYLIGVGTLIGGAGAFIAGIAACRALGTWRGKLHGEARFDLAKRLLIAAHDFAEKFHDARSRVIVEPGLAAVLNNPEATGPQRAGAYEMAFDARWEHVRVSGAQLLSLLPEAKSLLPPNVAEAANELLKVSTTLRASMAEFVGLVRDYNMGGTKPDLPPGAQAEWHRVRKDVYSSDPRNNPDTDNPLTQQFIERHEALVKVVRPYIERAGG